MDIGLSVTKLSKLFFATTQTKELENNPTNTKQVLSITEVQMSKFAKHKQVKKSSCVHNNFGTLLLSFDF